MDCNREHAPIESLKESEGEMRGEGKSSRGPLLESLHTHPLYRPPNGRRLKSFSFGWSSAFASSEQRMMISEGRTVR